MFSVLEFLKEAGIKEDILARGAQMQANVAKTRAGVTQRMAKQKGQGAVAQARNVAKADVTGQAAKNLQTKATKATNVATSAAANTAQKAQDKMIKDQVKNVKATVNTHKPSLSSQAKDMFGKGKDFVGQHKVKFGLGAGALTAGYGLHKWNQARKQKQQQQPMQPMQPMAPQRPRNFG